MVVRIQGCAWAPPPRMGGEAREGPRCDLAFVRSSERYKTVNRTAQGTRLDHHETVPHVPIIMRIMVDVTMTAHDDGR